MSVAKYIRDHSQAHERPPRRGALLSGLDAEAPQFSRSARLRTMGHFTVRSVSDVRVIEVSHGDERTMEAVRLTVMMSLADPSCPVVVDLLPLAASTEPIRLSALDDLAALSWHWPATPVALASPSPQVQVALQQLKQGEDLVVTTSLQEAMTILSARPEQITVELRLAPHRPRHEPPGTSSAVRCWTGNWPEHPSCLLGGQRARHQRHGARQDPPHGVRVQC